MHGKLEHRRGDAGLKNCARSPFLWCLTLLWLATATPVHANNILTESLTPSVEVDPRGAVHLVARFLNTGAVPIDLEPSWTLPLGWRWVVPPAPLHLAPGDEVNSFVTVQVPPDWPAGRASIEVRAGPEGGGTMFEVWVRAHRELHAALLDNPGAVVQEPYSLRFLVTNRGNQTERVQLDLRHDARFTVVADAASLIVPAGGSSVLTVEVQPPPELMARIMHVVRLSVASEGSGVGTSAHASAQTEVLPLALQSAPRHRYDMRLRLTAGVASSGDGVTWGTGLAAPGLRIDGRGALDPDGVHRLTVTGRADLAERTGRFTVRYQAEGLRLTAGHHTLRFTPLLSLGSGVGASVLTEHDLGGAWSLTAHTGFLARKDGLALGASVELGWAERLSVTVSATGTPGGPTFGVRLRGRPVLGPDVEAAIDVEALLEQGGTISARAALDVDAGPLRLTARWSQSDLDAPESGWRHMSARATVRVPSSELQDLNLRSIEYSAWLQHRQPRLGSSAVSWPFAWGAQGTFRGNYVTTTLSYVERQTFEPEALRRRELGVRLRLPWADGLDLLSKLVWTHADGATSWGHPSVELAGTLRLSSGGGRGSAQFRLGLEPGVRRPALETTWRWQFPVVEGLHLNAGAQFRLDPTWSMRLDLLGNLSLPRDWGLEIGVASGIRAGRAPSWQAHVTLSVPIGVPLGALGPTGGVEGRIVDERGAPVAGVRLRVIDQVTFTDADGAFRFAALPTGAHHLNLTPPLSHAGHFILPGTPWIVTVQEGMVTRVDFDLLPSAGLVVELVLEAGALGAAPSREGLILRVTGPRVSQMAATDASGVVRLEGLQPGSYRIEVDPRQAPFGHRFVDEQVVVDLRPGQTTLWALILRGAIDDRRIVDGGTLAR